MQGAGHDDEFAPVAWDPRTDDLGDADEPTTLPDEVSEPATDVDPDTDPAPDTHPALDTDPAPDTDPASEPAPVPDPEPTADPAPDAPPPEVGRLDAVLDGIGAMADTLDAVHAQTREAVRVQRRHADHVDELHAENQRLRRGELASALAPMVRDVIRLHDEVTRLTAVSAPESAEDMQIIGVRVLDLLARWGVTDFAPAVDDAFDPSAHQGVGRADGASSHVVVVEVIRRGFRAADGKMIRPADVIVSNPPRDTAAPQPDDLPDAASGGVE